MAIFPTQKKSPRSRSPSSSSLKRGRLERARPGLFPFIPLYIIGGLTVFNHFLSPRAGWRSSSSLAPSSGRRSLSPPPWPASPRNSLSAASLSPKRDSLIRLSETSRRPYTCGPTYSSAFYNRGLTYTRLEQYEDGIRDFTTAISIVPEHQGRPFLALP